MNYEIIDMLDEGYQEAIKVLKQNITPLGFSATTERHVNYYSVWARDHSITALAALQTDDSELIQTAKKGVLLLLQHQSEAGQIPTYIEIENRKKVYGGLGTITSVDSNLWIAIIAAEIYHKTKDKRFISEKQMDRYKRIYRLIKAFDSNKCGLLEVHIAGDWADVFNRTYHVLYDECLHYQALKSLEYLFDKHIHLKKQTEKTIKRKKMQKWISNRRKMIKPILNSTFIFTRDNIEKVKEKYMIYTDFGKVEYPYYQSHLTPFKNDWHQRFETFGNSLAMLTGVASAKRSKAIIEYVFRNKINLPVPIPVLYPPVFEHESDWEPIYSIKEQPFVYHNGGIWPMVTGFWIASLTQNNKQKQARSELEAFAKELQNQHWTFNEYLHGKTADPLGRNYQAWSAAGYVLAYNSVMEGKKPFHIDKTLLEKKVS